MLACIIVIAGLDILHDLTTLLKPAAEFYAVEPSQLAKQLESLLEHNLGYLAEILTKWYLNAMSGHEKKEGDLPRRLATRAKVDYGLAAYDVARRSGDVEWQKEIGAKLPFWLREIGRHNEAEQLEDQQVALLSQTGNAAEMAKSLYDQGFNLMLYHAYPLATSKLRQALRLAESSGDSQLASRAERALDQIKMSVRLQSK